jgi:hypothetical protein
MATRGKELVIFAMCVVAATAFATATVGPAFGVYPSTGIKEDVDQTNEAYQNKTGEVSEDGTLNPAAALGIVSRTLTLLTNLDQAAINLGVPPVAARYFTYPISAVIAWTLLMIVLRMKL